MAWFRRGSSPGAALVLALSAVLWTLGGCSGGADVPTDTPSTNPPDVTPTVTPPITDADGDGFSGESGDCNDSNDQIYPGADEIPYDGIDQDCDGDDLVDVDGDGYASTEADGDDCDDSDADVHPKAKEVAYDGIDQDCKDGDLVDVDGDGVNGGPDGEDCDDRDVERFPGNDEVAYDGIDQDCDGSDLVDVDLDGQAATEAAGTDCDDSDDTIYLGASELPYDGIDQDCSGSDLVDVDGDSFAAIVAGGLDCDDQDINTYPGAVEFKDGKDNDCDGTVDNHLDNSDDDKDGFAEDTGDCNDNNNTIYPGATEIPYDGIDQDCSSRDLTDVDGDGQDATLSGGQDCNDADISVYAGATEVPYDTIDQDCNGSDLVDVDGDGVASSAAGGKDCDDNNLNVNPSATEVCNGIDDDCKNGIDTDATDRNTYYTDSDGDGYGNPSASVQACSISAGQVSNKDDCNDASAAINPAAQEICNSKDDDCDGKSDDADSSVTGQNTFYVDADADGYGSTTPFMTCASAPALGYSTSSTDCNDADPKVNPGKTELCNNVDDNCSGVVDEGVKSTFYQDADGDKYGNASMTTEACSAPAGYVTDKTDCDDAKAAVNPGATETCNSVDDDCDGATDDADSSVTGQTTFYADVDGDGYGNASSTKKACSQPTGFVTNKTDCADGDADVNPGEQEVCNAVDDDCDGAVDDADSNITGQSVFYADVDGDGYGNASVSKKSCARPTGFVTDKTDCLDSDNSVNPGAQEVCNSKDDDCDTLVDDADSSVTGQSTFYADADGDGYGSASSSKKACSKPTGYVTNKTDCLDSDVDVNPGEQEVCNGKDDDCDTLTDDADDSVTGQTTFYADVDGDGYGNATSTKKACSKPTGYVTDKTDCADGDAAVNPGAQETCNSKDDDCDGLTDDADPSASGLATFYADVDGDGYGNSASTKNACAKPTGFVTSSTDCNDADATVNPGATEVCNSKDDDCDSLTDDADSSVTGQATFYADSDGDGYGNASSSKKSCTRPTGYVTSATDCNDADAAINPGATETCNSKDDDCDSLTDDADSSVTG